MNPLQWWKTNVSLHLRNAEPQDTVHLMQIDVKGYDNAWDLEDWRKLANDPAQNAICITRHSLPIAFTAYEIDGSQLKVLRLSVTPKYRRQGLGKSMVGWIDRLMRDKRMKRATCIVPINNLIACNFLKATGWKVPPKGGIMQAAFDDCGTPIEGLFFIKEAPP